MTTRRGDDDFAREVESHLDLETDRLIAEGLSPRDARLAAERRFGSSARARERFYESRRVLWLDHLRHDVIFAWRTLRRSPAFAAIAIVTLAISIGATTAIATQVRSVFLGVPAVAAPASLRLVSWSSPKRGFTDRLFRDPQFDTRRISTFPERLCRDVQQSATSFSDVACWRRAGEAMTENALYRVQAVSGNYFRTLGIHPVAGRAIDESDNHPGAPFVAMARAPELLNTNVRLHGHLFTVVGILPDDFWGLAPLAPADLVVPFATDHVFPVFQRNAWAESRIVVRLRAGVSEERARQEAELLVQRFVAAQPPAEPYEQPRVYLEDVSSSLTELQEQLRRPLALLAVMVALLVALTCTNIGGLLSARAVARQREIATRLAIGGSRRRVAQQLLTEALILSGIGAACGIALAFALSSVLQRVLVDLGGGEALGLSVRPDFIVLTFVVSVSVACGLLFGMMPVISTVGVRPAESFSRGIAGGRTPARVGKSVLIVQVALSMVVLIGAGLLLRSVVNLREVPLGYQPEGLIFVETNNPVGRPRLVVENALAALRGLPGIESAAVSQWPIFNNATPRGQICVPGEATAQALDYSFVFPGFFHTWGVRFVRGRDIDETTAPQVVVNEAFVRRYLTGVDPLTATISMGFKGCPGPTQLPIVGVVADHIDRQRVEVIPAVYGRYPRAGALYVTTYAVRALNDERALIPALRRVIADHGIAPNRDVMRAVDYRDSVTQKEQLLMQLLLLFAAVALFIACLGIYGLLAYAAQRRTAEIGVRVAVGAQRRHVIVLMMRESAVAVIAGLLVGAAGALIVSRMLEPLLFHVTPSDPAAYVAAGAVLLLAAAVSSWLPATRASRLDPLPALRCE